MARPATKVLFLASAIALLIAAPASASQSIATKTFTAAAPVAGKVHVDLQVKRFIQRQRQTQAAGVVTATLKGLNGSTTTATRRVLLQVRPGRRCQILLLTLNQLDLTLLGVNVHLDRVRLRITGRPRGGVLGQLFCSLAGARLRTAKVATVASLNRGLRQHSLHPMGFTVTARPAQAPTNICPILDLTLGPLHLDLLGLVVDLNRVHLTITANRNGGLLGSLLCGLSNTPVPVPPVPVPPVPAA